MSFEFLILVVIFVVYVVVDQIVRGRRHSRTLSVFRAEVHSLRTQINAKVPDA